MVRKAKLFEGLLLVLIMIVGASCSQSVTGGAVEGPPDPPKNLKADIVDRGIHLSWDCVPGASFHLSWDCVPGASFYTVFWGSERDEYRNLVNAQDCSATLVGLRKNEFYAFAVTAWNQHGESNYSQGAEVIYDDDPGRADYYLVMGNDRMKRGHYKSALTYFSTAIRLAPDSPQAYQRRALLYEKTKRSDLAKQDYQMAEKLLKRKPLSKNQQTPLD
ncbi:MAG: hypothetical protein P8182_08005 [Deltaproteobacteria bacterium]